MPHLDGSARAAATRAADLLTVIGPTTAATEPDVVIDILRRYGEPEPFTLTAEDVTDLRAAACAVWEVFCARSTDDAADHLNGILRTYAQPPRLLRHDNTPWHLHVDGADDGPWGAWFASSSALALATLLAERQANPAGRCESPSCGLPFIDFGQGDRRRYCSPRCSSRERVAAHRRRTSTTAYGHRKQVPTANPPASVTVPVLRQTPRWSAQLNDEGAPSCSQ